MRFLRTSLKKGNTAMPLNYLYTRLHLTLTRLTLVELFIENNQGLEELSQDLSLVVKEREASTVYDTVVLMDILEMHALSLLETRIEQLCEEFELLVKSIRENAQKYTNYNLGQLYAVHLEYPDCLVLEYRPVKDK